MAITGHEVWIALTAQGHKVSIEVCEKIADRGHLDLWVCEERGAYLTDRHEAEDRDPLFYGDGAWLIREGQVQPIAVDLLPRLLRAMVRMHEL